MNPITITAVCPGVSGAESVDAGADAVGDAVGAGAGAPGGVALTQVKLFKPSTHVSPTAQL